MPFAPERLKQPAKPAFRNIRYLTASLHFSFQPQNGTDHQVGAMVQKDGG
jgi:hypothetical protein